MLAKTENPPFEIVINTRYNNEIENKYTLSLLNDFENGSWRKNKFIKFLFDNVKLTALSDQERNALSSKESSLLEKACKKLRIDKEGGEIGEIMLYGIMKEYYNALPVVPKIFYKQNPNDYAKGADSVHIVLEKNDNFSLWLGESKFYKDIKQAFTKATESIKNLLQEDPLKKEFSLITNYSDLDSCVLDETKCNNIKDLLSNDTSLDRIKPFLHIPIFLLHECNITKDCTAFDPQYKKAMENYYLEIIKSFFNQLDTKLQDIYHIQKITFHIILFPCPNKKEIVDKFGEKAESYKN